MAKKGKRVNIMLACEEGSGHFYTTTTNQQNNQQNNTGKLRLRKYNPKLRKYCWYVEKKIKS